MSSSVNAKWGRPLDSAASVRMTRVHSRDTKPELRLRSILHARGRRFRVDVAPEPSLRRRADLIFPRARVAVFVDGCFWHGCPQHASWPVHNAALWKKKIENNRRRDAETTKRLLEAGWRVVRVWEHEDAQDAANRIECELAQQT